MKLSEFDIRTADTGRVATVRDVWNCYRLFLDREPDPAGFEAYANVVARGVSLAELTRMFIASPEYAAKVASPPNPAIQRASLADFDLFVPAADAVVGEEILACGTYEPHVTAALEGVLRPGMTVVDVGANIGYFSVLAARRVGPGGRVFAFEPLPRNVRLLLANREINEAHNLTIYPFGASDREGFLSLMAMGSIASSRHAELADVTTVNALELTYAKRIDDTIPAAPDVIKIDVDGFDHPAMQGAERSLRSCQHVFAEFAPGLLEELSVILPTEYLKLYEAAGFGKVSVLHRDGRVQASTYPEVAGLPERLGQTHVDLHLRR